MIWRIKDIRSVYALAYSIFLFVLFLPFSFIVNSLTNMSREKKRRRRKNTPDVFALLVFKRRKRKKISKVPLLFFSFFIFPPISFFFSLLWNFKPTSRFLIDLTKLDLHSNWSRSVHLHLHVVERQKSRRYAIRFFDTHVISYSRTKVW